ncbi:peptidoglycan-binding domain-containing protein [Peribacillus frigoritolerans]|uniref:peptidoglycan-binding domain-containing protein n=1 Tax=Peribacillus frigoritolerans TaxID=450367 RepID=UPI003BAF751E
MHLNSTLNLHRKFLKRCYSIFNINCGKLEAIFGKGTESAVSKFQKAKGITADKKAGTFWVHFIYCGLFYALRN